MNTADASPTGSSPERGRRIGPALARTLHLYLSMAGLAATLFFSVTGLTLNHPDWLFGSTRQEESLSGTLDPAWLNTADPAGVGKLEIVEYFRSQHGVRGALEEFRVDPGELLVSFMGPGYAADFFVDRRTGRYQATAAYEGMIAVVNDLHKGRHTGPVWAWIIDISAGLLAVVSVTGLLLLLYTRRRRSAGMITAFGGLAVCLIVMWLWVG